MKTKLVNGARTPEVIADELKRTCRLVGVFTEDNGLLYHYYVNPELTDKAIEVIYRGSKAVAVRQLAPQDIKYLTTGLSIPYDFIFGGF